MTRQIPVFDGADQVVCYLDGQYARFSWVKARFAVLRSFGCVRSPVQPDGPLFTNLPIEMRQAIAGWVHAVLRQDGHEGPALQALRSASQAQAQQRAHAHAVACVAQRVERRRALEQMLDDARSAEQAALDRLSQL